MFFIMTIPSNQPNFELFRSTHVPLSDLKMQKDGTLKKKSLMDKILHVFTSKADQQKEREAIKEKLITYIDSIKDSSNEEEIINIFSKISKLRDAQLIVELKEKNILTQDIENILSENLNRNIPGLNLKLLRENKRKLQGKDARQLEEVKLAIRIEKAKLAESLGIEFIANKGATGTALIRNLKGKYIAVFKPTHEATPLKAKILNKIKRAFGGQLYYLGRKTDAQAKAEVGAYKLDRHFNFGLSPASQFVELGGKQGTFQSFLTKFEEAKSLLGTSSETSYSWSLDEFQKMTIFDYLIGNLDRHEENWGVAQIKKDSEGTSLRVIDNANSFLCKNPEAGTSVKNQYKWKNLEIAKTPFTEQTKDFIQRNLTDANLDSFFEMIFKELPGFLEEEMKAGLKERLHVIQGLSQKGGSPAQLGNIISDADIFLHT